MARPIPRFWWDFSYEPDRVIVESTDPRRPVVKTFSGIGDAQVAAAEALVKDLTEGRADFRRVH
jgi:hypothetical protein